MAASNTEIEEEYAKYRAIQADIQTLYATKQQTLSQFNENTMVSEELALLEPSAPVFKLVGPALLTVSLEDAKQNVNKRLEFISAEITKVEAQIGLFFTIPFTLTIYSLILSIICHVRGQAVGTEGDWRECV